MLNLPNKVKAAVMVEPGKMEIREYPYPKIDDNSAVVRIEMSGVCGTDLHLFRGESLTPYGEAPFPIINGHENVGTIVEIGKNAKKNLECDGKELAIGDRVLIGVRINCGKCWFCNNQLDYIKCENQVLAYGCYPSVNVPPHLRGGWAEYMYIAPGTTLYKIPEYIPNEIAVFTEPMAVANGSIKKAQHCYPSEDEFRAGSTVVIIGNGPLGILHGVMAKICGAGMAIAIDLSDLRLKTAKEFYADHVINIVKKTIEDRIKEVRELTNGRGVDLAIETAGRPEAFVEALDLIRKGGTVLEVGNWAYAGHANVNPQAQICNKGIHIHSQGTAGHIWGPVLNILWDHSKTFNFEKLISHKMNLNQLVENMATTIIDPHKCNKVIVTPNV